MGCAACCCGRVTGRQMSDTSPAAGAMMRLLPRVTAASTGNATAAAGRA